MRLTAPGEQVVLRAAAGEVVEHLVGLHPRAARKRDKLVEVWGVEVADAPVADLPAGTSSSNPATVSASGTRPRQCSRYGSR